MHLAAPVGQPEEPITLLLQLPEQRTHPLHLANDKLRIATAKLAYLVGILRHCLRHVIDDSTERLVFAVETLVPSVGHKTIVEVDRLLVCTENLVEHQHIIIIDKHLAEVEYQILYHNRYCYLGSIVNHKIQIITHKGNRYFPNKPHLRP